MNRKLPAPVGGKIPEVVGRWAPALQVEWFTAFGAQLVGQAAAGGHPEHEWDDRAPDLRFEDYYVTSTQHRGCCMDATQSPGPECCPLAAMSGPGTVPVRFQQ